MDSTRQLAVHAFLQRSGWMEGGFNDLAPDDIGFLAAGEYNENYLVRTGRGQSCVFRINHGSQLGLERQIEYEFRVLEALAGSGATPRPFHVEPAPDPALGLGNGVMLMQFLPGRSLRYETDLDQAAAVFAATHSQPVEGPANRLVVQADPVRDIASESLGLIKRFPDHPRTRERDLLLAYHEKVLALARENEGIFAEEPLVIANTEVNSGNFLIDGPKGWLVDWEKAVISCRYQDLGHFLVPTTTRWKTSFTFTPEARRAFLGRYRDKAGLSVSLDELSLRTGILERTILLRALSWCYMAWYEYTRPGRALANKDTFATITAYLDDMEWIAA